MTLTFTMHPFYQAIARHFDTLIMEVIEQFQHWVYYSGGWISFYFRAVGMIDDRHYVLMIV